MNNVTMNKFNTPLVSARQSWRCFGMPVIFAAIASFFCTFAYGLTSVTNAELSAVAGQRSLVIELSSKTKYKVFSLTNPDRLVVDLEEVDIRSVKMRFTSKSLISGINEFRFGIPFKGTTRLVLDLNNSLSQLNVSEQPAKQGKERIYVRWEMNTSIVSDNHDKKASPIAEASALALPEVKNPSLETHESIEQSKAQNSRGGNTIENERIESPYNIRLVDGKFVHVPIPQADPKSAPQPAPEPVPQPAPKSVPQSAPGPAAQLAPKSVPQPAPEPVLQPAPKSVPQSVPEPAAQLAPKPVPQPAPEPVLQPAPKLVPQSAPESILKHASNSNTATTKGNTNPIGHLSAGVHGGCNTSEKTCEEDSVGKGRWYTLVGVGQVTGNSDKKMLDTEVNALGGSGLSSGLSSSAGYKVQAGYKINKNFAIEGGYIGSRNKTYTVTAGNPAGAGSGANNITGWSLTGVGILPIDNRYSLFPFSLIGKLGIADIKESANLTYNGFNGTSSGTMTSLTFGIGAQLDFTKSAFGRISVDNYGIGSSTISNRYTGWTIDAGYKF